MDVAFPATVRDRDPAMYVREPQPGRTATVLGAKDGSH